MRFDDLTDQTINRIKFLSFSRMNDHGKALWLCLCPLCDSIFETLAASVKTGRTSSCGCLKAEVTSEYFAKDLVGETFGKLVVISYVGNPKSGKDDRPRRVYLCRCECGVEKEIRSDDLLSGRTVSCTCEQRRIVTKHGKSKEKGYRSAQAKIRRERKAELDSDWTVEMEFAIRKYYPACVICGSNDRLAVDHVYPLSRGFGIIPGNAVILCKSCNASKTNKFPEHLSSEWRDIIFAAADEFEKAWESGYRA